MTKPRHFIRRRGEHGQVLVLVFVIAVILLFAVFFLFDIQQVIRSKMKSRSAIDAAALVGAEWQRNTLNMIGEINLIKATTAIIDDFTSDSSSSANYLKITNPDDPEGDLIRIKAELARLQAASEQLTQMQVRLSFVGPLLGLGAAEQAALNNGLVSSNDFAEVAARHLEELQDDSVYGPDVLSQTIEGYTWRAPYVNLLKEVFQAGNRNPTGIAAAPNVQYLGYPNLSNPNGMISISLLSNETVFDAINANMWCEIRDLIRMDFGADGTNWWGDVTLATDSSNFPEESEYLPVNVKYTGSTAYTRAENTQAFYGADGRSSSPTNPNLLNQDGRKTDYTLLRNVGDYSDPYLYDTNGDIRRDEDGNPIRNVNDTDWKFNPLAVIRWAVFDSRYWYNYSSDNVDDWQDYLRSDFKEGYTYRSGAISYMTARFIPDTISGQWTKIAEDADDSDSDDQYVADSFLWANTSKSKSGTRMKNAEKQMRNGLRRIHTTALAKPLGRLNTVNGYLPPQSAYMVLPVFDTVTLIPVSLPDNPGNSAMNNPYFMAFLTEYLPKLGTVDSLSEMETWMAGHPHGAWFQYYHQALVKLSSAEWRAQGITWLEQEARGHDEVDEDGNTVHIVDATNEDLCNYWPSSGSGPRSGPSSLH